MRIRSPDSWTRTGYAELTMYWKKHIKPPNPVYYMSRCIALRKLLDRGHKTPPVMIADGCWDVLREVFGGQYKALAWTSLGVLISFLDDCRYLIQFNWHVYVRLRTYREAADRMFPTRVDVDRIAEFESESEFERYLDSVVSEDENNE